MCMRVMIYEPYVLRVRRSYIQAEYDHSWVTLSLAMCMPIERMAYCTDTPLDKLNTDQINFVSVDLVPRPPAN